MADEVLTFLGWSRERIAGLATGVTAGRARVETGVTLSGTDTGGAATQTATRTVRFLLSGPADVIGLVPGTVSRRFPTPGAIDHASDRCPYVEISDPSLPWRYTPAPKPAAGTGFQHPWLVLVVGEEGPDLLLAADRVTLTRRAQAGHVLGTPFPWAHVQVDGSGRRVARLLSGRPLQAGTDYVAVLVPAFTPAGTPAWDGSAPVTLALLDHWRFRTASPAGSFEDLAGRLQPGAADPETGRAALDYPRVPAAGDLQVRGALAPLGAQDDPLPAAIAEDLAALRTSVSDPVGRPIVGLPRYGDTWRLDAPEATTWGGTLNSDPRDRGVGGLGLELGIRLQEVLATEASASLGALAEARQKIAHLVLGLRAATALWKQRLPTDPFGRLWVLGPGLRRVVTPAGSVADLATAPDRALPAGIFSTAARRVLRAGPARTTLTAEPVTPARILEAANRCPLRPEPTAAGVPLDGLGIDLRDLLVRLEEIVQTGEADLGRLLNAAGELADQAHPHLADLARAIVERLAEAAGQRTPAPWAEALGLLVAASTVRDDGEVQALAVAMRLFLERFPGDAGETDVSDLVGIAIDPEPQEPPCVPVDLAGLADGVSEAFDPTGPDGPALVRVLDTIDGLDPAQPLAPPEICVGLDRPVWSDVRDAFAEWLLPGVGALLEDTVVALETNPRFVDDLLVGLNTQLLAELRWRNIPVATGCTPLRTFWDRNDTGSGARVDDITGIHAWSEDSDVGDAQHRPAGASGRDLVVVVRGPLFRRYPATLVYLTSAQHAGTTDFDQDPDPATPRVLPSFQGRIAPDVNFFGFQGFDPEGLATHWVAFEEPPPGYTFANDASADRNPVGWATASFAQPVRVLIRGDTLEPPGGP